MGFNFNKKGFTLIEMMVVIAILAIFTVISLADYKTFGKKQAFVNLMYDTALDFRQVQVSGIGVKETSPGTDEFNVGYGIHFVPSSSNTSYQIFADRPNPDTGTRDNTYVVGVDTSISVHTFETGYTIQDICGINNSVKTCLSATNGYMDIVFARPNPDAIISINNTADLAFAGLDQYFEGAEIYIQSPEGDVRTLYVDASGQISVR
jgi:prepilin-type N-terminal cleavage/methylation domain-containing protein